MRKTLNKPSLVNRNGGWDMRKTVNKPSLVSK